MFTYQGVNDGKLSLNRFVHLVSTTAAKTFGLYPNKGSLGVGSDGDLVIWNPNAEFTMTRSALHGRVDYTLYEGQKLRGMPATVTLRGHVIVDDRQYVGTLGGRRLIARSRYDA